MPPLPKILTDDEISTIAREVRTRPLSEVGRHVMPLIQHIVATEAKSCNQCRSWVAYNQTDQTASVGECTYHYSPDARLKIISDAENVAMTTPFDWHCPAWESKEVGVDAAQMESR